MGAHLNTTDAKLRPYKYFVFMPLFTSNELARREFAGAIFDLILGVMITMTTGKSLYDLNGGSFERYLWVFGYCLIFLGLILFVVALYHILSRPISDMARRYPLAVFLCLPPLFLILLLVDRLTDRKRN